MIPERLKTSRRLQAEVALAGLALWYLKKELYPKYTGPTQGEDNPPPVSESIEDGYVYVIPGQFDENGKPKIVEVGAKLRDRYVNVQGRIRDVHKRSFIAEDGSARKRKQLRALKSGIALTRQKMLSRLDQ